MKLSKFLGIAILGVSLAALMSLACRAPRIAFSPTQTPTVTHTRLPTETPIPTHTPTSTPEPILTPTITQTATPSGPFYYAVQEGETLAQIAERFGVDLEIILALNPGLNPELLVVGQQILIPAPGTTMEPTPTITTLSGWTRYDLPEEGFTIAIPEGWVPWSIDPEVYQDVIEEAIDQYPELADSVETSGESLAASGAKFIALDVGDYDPVTKILTNLSVMTQYLGMDMKLEFFAEFYKVQMESMDFVSGEVEIEYLTFMGGDCALFTYTTAFGDYELAMYQFVFISNQTGYILTMTTSTDMVEALDPVFNEIAGSFVIYE